MENEIVSSKEVKCWSRKEWRTAGGLIHRNIRPAVIYDTGTKEWWRMGHRHRTTGPAIIRKGMDQWSHSEREYWLLGKRLKDSVVELALGMDINIDDMTEDDVSILLMLAA